MSAPSFATISFSNNTLTYSSTSDLSTTIDPSGQKDVASSYGVSKSSFQALNPQIVAFNSAPAASQTLRTLVANYDASNTVTFTFPSAMYNYGSVTTSGRGAFSGSNARHAISTVPVQNGSLYDWFDATISTTGGQSVQSLGFCAAFRSDQAVAAGEVLYTLSDASTETVTLPTLGGSGNPEYVFIGYTAPSGKTITRVQAARTSAAGGGYVSVDDLSFVMSGDTTAPAAVSDLATTNPTSSSITLTWTAPGDDGSTGTAVLYDVRYSTSAINAGNWDTATPIGDEPTPAAADTVQNMVISGLSADTTYYFAMKTFDEVPNASGLSNSPSGTTLGEGDTTAPAAVTNLATSSPTSSSLTLTWTAPGDNGSTGTATSYDIRYSTSAIDAGNWVSATQVIGEPAPAAAGTSQNLVVSGLTGGTTYYFAIKTSDEVPNTSALSNVPSGTTSAASGSTIVALKRDSGLTAGGATDARFDGATVRTVNVADATIYTAGESCWMNGGAAGAAYGAHVLYKFDLSSIPAGATVNLAQMRLYHTGGNGGAGNGDVSMVLTHAWSEGAGSYTYPGATAGISYAHPSGTNTGPSQNATGGGTAPLQTWGTGNDSFFSITADAGFPIAPSSAPSGTGYHVIDVTSHVQQWVSGTYPNYGWAQPTGTWDFHMSEAGTVLQPVLFIDYLGDTTAPATVTNLATSSPTASSITLTWTAPGDDGSTGQATSYDIRYSTSAINDSNWASATPVTGEPTPSVAGTNQTMVVSGLSAGTTYYFALKTSDEIPNTAILSNVANGTTTSSGGITPAGAIDTATRGTWKTVYGADGYILFSFEGTPGYAGTDVASLPGYISGYSTSLSRWLWAVNTSDAYDLQQPSGSNRNIGCLYTDTAGTITLVPSQTQDFTLRLYLRDVGAAERWDSLSFTGAGLTGTDSIQCTAGKWVSYPVHATVGTNVVINLAWAAGINSTISAILFDAVSDTTAPAAISNLATSSPAASSITLTWTAPGDDNSTGTASSYDIRYRTGGAIDANNWATATQVTGEPAPAAAGTNQNMIINGLSASTTYYFAIKTADEVPNTSALSNSPSGTTTSGSGITPAGTVDTTTQGTWQGVYGADGHILFSFNGTPGWPGTDVASLPGYISDYSTNLYRYVWAVDTGNAYDLQQPGGSTRKIGCVYTDVAGTITLVPSQNKDFTLRLYLRDQDALGRSETLSFTGAGLTGTDLIECTAGKWVSYPVHATVGTNIVIYLERVTAVNAVISAILFDSTPGSDTTAPAAVSNLATSSPTASSLTLSWTAPGDDNTTGTAASYDIRYRTGGAIDANNWATATQVTGEPAPAAADTNQTMVVSGLSAGTTYYFAIKTADEVPNTSGLSNSPSGTTAAADSTAPAAVNNLAAGSPTSSSLTLTWTAPGDDNSTGTATTYDIRYRTGGVIDAGNWASATQCTGEPAPLAASNNQSFVVHGLSPSTTYYFAIKTADEIPNWSGLSNSPSGQTTAPGASAQVALKRNPGLVAGGGIDARFSSASVVTTTVQDAQIWGVQHSRWYNGGITTESAGGSNGVSWVTYKFDLVGVPAYAHINLAQLRLKAWGEAGTPSLAMILTHDWTEGTQYITYPGAAGGVTYWAPTAYNTDYNQDPSGAYTGTELWGTWGPNSDRGLDMAVDGGPLLNPSPQWQGYYVYDVTAHVQTWLRAGRPNFGWVQLDWSHISLSESGSDTQPVLFIDYALEGDTTPPATIANLATSNVTNRSVTLSWTAPGDDGSTGTASGYEIRYAKSPITAASWALATPITGVPAPQAAGTGQSVVVSGPATGLLGNTTYYFAIKASDEMPNVAALSNVASAQTPADTVAPAAVANLAAGSATNHSLTLTWTAPGDDGSSTGTATTYDIRYSTGPINASNWDAATPVTNEPAPTAGGTGQSLVIDNLNQNTTYYFAMKTADEVPNTSGLSNVASGQVLADTIAPGAVTSLMVTKTKSSALRLTWIASGDDGTERTATSYDIRYRTGGAVTEGNWASCTQVTGEPVAVQPGYHPSMWISGLSASTTYYIGIKALDEVSNASSIATTSATTPAASNLTRPLLQPSDLEYLGAFKLPQWACGYSTGNSLGGLAVRRVSGNLQFLACTHSYADGVYECNFPGWGADASTWPQATLIREWGMDVYGNPPVKPLNQRTWTAGLSYDQATGRLYYSFADPYTVGQENLPSLACAVLAEGGPVVSGPWVSQNIHMMRMRGGSLAIPDWFATTYLGGRTLGVGFGGANSGWASCSPGPTLAAAHHPDEEDTELDTIPLLQYYQDDIAHWATRPTGYWWRTAPVYGNCHLPDGDIGYWTGLDGNAGGVWIDLPDKQGLLYVDGLNYGGLWYDDGTAAGDYLRYWWRVYDPADLAEVAQSNMDPWEPQHDTWRVQELPDSVNKKFTVTGIAFDAQTRTLFVYVAQAYNVSTEWYPVVYGYHIAE